MDEEFQEVLRGFQEREKGLILVVVDVGGRMSLRISLGRGYMTEVLNRGMDASVIEANNQWRKIE